MQDGVNPRGQTLKVKAIDRQRKVLAPIEVEKLVSPEHPVRAIWEFAGKLNLSAFYEEVKSLQGAAGRPVFAPELLISLWVLAYSEGVHSAREISKRCKYSPPYQWLTGAEVINYHTLADFRVDHKEALDDLFIQTLGILSAAGLITLERVMQDGTRIKANAGADSFRTEEHLQEHLKLARLEVERMSTIENGSMNRSIAQARRRAAREELKRHESAMRALEKIRSCQRTDEERKNARASTTDPECRIMKESNGGYAPNYNVQVSTDSKNGVVIAVEAVQSPADIHQLIPTIPRIQNNLNQTPKQIVADAGLTGRESIIEFKKKEST